MESLGLIYPDTRTEYWFASRKLRGDRGDEDIENNATNNRIDMNVRYMNLDMADSRPPHYFERILYISCNSTEPTLEKTVTRPVRPIITISANLLAGATQTGLRNDPIIIN